MFGTFPPQGASFPPGSFPQQQGLPQQQQQPGHQPGAQGSNIIEVYKLRSKATCEKTDMNMAAAGRSVIVAEMFQMTPAEVRNIWWVQCQGRDTRPHKHAP